MSIEGISNYQHAGFTSIRPEWQVLERYDYCDQDILPEKHHYLGRLFGFVKRMMQ